MLELHAGSLFETFGCVMTYCQAIKEARTDHRLVNIDKNVWQHLHAAMSLIRAEAERLKMPATLKTADRYLQYLGDCPEPERLLDAQAVAMLIGASEGVSNGLQGELQAKSCIVIPDRLQALFSSAEPLFGADVTQKFPSLNYDIEEAGKCLALGRCTASAFHSLRCLEGGLRAIARCLGVPEPAKGSDRNWQCIQDKISEELNKRWPSAADKMATDYKAFDKMRAALHALQNPYRNEAMHLDASYSGEEAAHIFEMVRGLMQTIARRCNEEGAPKA